MNIRDLIYLVAIGEHCNFNKAASACFVSQPALSMQIKKLETILGVQLIERTSKAALLTETGKLIQGHARDILSRVETIKEIAKQASDPECGELRLGIIPTLAPYLLPHVFPNLSKQFPKLRPYLIEKQTPYLFDMLRQGKLDGAIVALPTSEDLVTLPMFEEDFMLAVPVDHPLSKRKIIKVSDLKNKLLFLLEDGHCMRDQALALCRNGQASGSKEFEASSLETLRHMVAAKAGMTLMPKLAYKPNDGVHYLSFCSPTPSRTIGMVIRPSSAKKIILDKIVRQIKKVMMKKNIVKVINTPDV